MNNTDQFTDQQILAMTAWGEARGLGHDGMQATICTGQNRLSSGILWWGTTLRTVFLKPWQYSCWNSNDPNLSKLMAITKTDAQYKIALGLADASLSDKLSDITNQADSYFDTRMPKAPVWSIGLLPVFKLGPHAYYKTAKWTGS